MKRYYLLFFIFVLALTVRMFHFRESVYFGYDEARDAIVSQAIYKQGDLKITGPAANGVTGLNHGVLHWYLIGIFYLIGGGNPFFVSFIFRLLNALAVFPVFWVSEKLFGKRTAYLASTIFAVSFEATQYAMYFGNPSLAVWSWILLYVGAVIVYKSKNKFWGLPLMAIGISTGAQFELFLVTLLPLGIIVLVILKNYLKEVSLKSWLLAVTVGIGIVSTYILGEFKNGFRSVELILNINSLGQVLDAGQKWGIYFNRLILMLSDNFSPLGGRVLWPLGFVLLVFIALQLFQKKTEYSLLLSWIFGGAVLTIIGSYNVYYINVGIGTGLIIGLANFTDKAFYFNKYIGAFFIILSILGNLKQVRQFNGSGLIEGIKTQQFMQLNHEIAIVKQMYVWADKKTFTVRVTSMPYRVQTVWAYLFNQFGLPVYGYLPYYETGNVLGFEGYLPVPKDGTTCIRFLLKEPSGGIHKILFDNDEAEENLFSTVDETIKVGHFVLEKRTSKDKVCSTDNFPSL